MVVFAFYRFSRSDKYPFFLRMQEVFLHFLFVYQFWCFPLTWEFSYGNVIMTDEWLQILTYAQHLWSLSVEGSLACYTYGDTGQTFIMVISNDTQTYCRAIGGGTVTTCFYDLCLWRLGFEHPTLRLRVERIYRLRQRCEPLFFKIAFIRYISKRYHVLFCIWVLSLKQHFSCRIPCLVNIIHVWLRKKVRLIKVWLIFDDWIIYS